MRKIGATPLFLGILTAGILFFHSEAQCAEKSVSLEDASIERHILDNGMTLILKPMPQSSIATVLLMVKAGSASEGEFLGSGISHFVEHMLFKGTETRKMGEISREIESLGGATNGFTALDYTGYLISLPKENMHKGIEILADAAMNSRFDPQEVEKERKVILSEIRLGKDDPGQYIYELLFANAYRRHPYRHPIIGYEPLLKSLTRDDLLKYYKKMYAPNNIVFVVTGAFNPQNTLERVKAEFKNFKLSPYAAQALPEEPQQVTARQIEEAYPTELARVFMGFQGVSVNDKDLFALDLLANILGEGNDSRLYKEICKKRQLVYSIDTFNFTPMDKGLLAVSAVLEKEKTESAIEAVLGEIEKIKKEGITKKELEKAKRQVLSAYIFSRQTTAQIAGDIAVNEILTADPDFSQKYVRQVKRVSSADIRDAARKYLHRETLTIAVLSPLSQGDGPKPKAGAGKETEIKKFVLENGLTVLIKKDHSIPLVAVRAVFMAGARAENETNNGISNLTSRMLLLGTQKRSAQAIAAEIGFKGIRLEASSGNNSAGLSLDMLSQDFTSAMDIFADIIRNSIFPEAELSREKEKILAEIKAQGDDIFHLAFRQLKKALFKEHPYRFDTLGESESVKNIRRQDIIAFYRKFIIPNNMVLSIFGDVREEEALAVVKDRFGGFGPMPLSPLTFKESFPDKPARQWFGSPNSQSHKPLQMTVAVPKEQTVITLGFGGLKFTDPDRYCLEALNAILSSMSGRLFQHIRDELGQAYTLGGNSLPGIERGMYYLYAATTSEQVKRVKEILLGEIADLQKNYVSDEELAKVKAYLAGQQKLHTETSASRAFISALDELYGLGFDNYRRYQEKINKVAKEDIMRAARVYLNTENMVEVIVMPESALAEDGKI